VYSVVRGILSFSRQELPFSSMPEGPQGRPMVAPGTPPE
jgi:hypothetical protein